MCRAVRIRRGLTQEDVGQMASVSQSTVSLVERGRFERLSFDNVRRVASALDVSLSFDAHWRGVEGVKLLDGRHAALVRLALEKIRAAGWEVWPEKTFSIWGERGSIDVLAWHARKGALLAVEVKTRLPDLQDLLSTMDRKRRLLPAIAKTEGWKPLTFGSVLVLPEETWARNRLREFSAVFDAALPARTVQVRKWLAEPSGDLRGVWILLSSNSINGPRKQTGETRVSAHRRAVEAQSDGRIQIQAARSSSS